MATEVRWRRGTSAQLEAATPAQSEVIHNTETNRLHVGDGFTQGGHPTATLEELTNAIGAIRNVRTFGAKGNGSDDDAAAINAALAGGNAFVYFPPGQYVYKSPLRVFSNTTIEMNPDCVLLDQTPAGTHGFGFVNGEMGNSTYATGYNGDGNIVIRGGQMDGAYRVGISQPCCPLALGHGRNILIEGVRFRNNYKSHFIEMNSSQDVTVRKCVFDNLNPDDDINREMINVDFADAVGFPLFGSYDNTPMDNLLVEDCLFINGQQAIGTHRSPSQPHTRIRFLNNKIRNMSHRGVRALRWNQSIISGNAVDGVFEAGIVLEDCEHTFARDNVLTNTNTGTDVGGSSFFINGGSNCIVGPNRIDASGAAAFNWAYDIQSPGAFHKLDLTGADAGAHGILENGGTACEINGAFILRLADDQAMSLVVPGTSGSAMIAILSNLATSVANPRGIYWLNADGSPVAPSLIGGLDGTQVDYTTGALTGTTGVDGNFTISTHTDRRVYFENRSGNERVMAVQFIAGQWP